jgi:hypothetical protein
VTDLTRGRQILFGTSATPRYCPALHVARRGALQKNRVYVDTHIAMGEHLLSRLRGRPPGAIFLRRRATAYRAVSNLIANPDTSFDDQMFALCCLQMAEYALGQAKLQTMHLKAMDDFLNRRGGLDAFCPTQPRDLALMEPMIYINQFIFAYYEVDREESLSISENILSHLRSIRNWVETLTVADAQRCANRICLHEISEFLTKQVTRNLRAVNGDYSACAGTFHAIFNLAITMASLRLTASVASALLTEVQSVISQSGGGEIHPSVVSCIVSQIRGSFLVLPTASSKELSILSACVNCMKAFCCLGPATRLRVGRDLVRCILAVCDFTAAEVLGDLYLEDLCAELLSTGQ